MGAAVETPRGISTEKARSGLTNLQTIIGFLLLLSAASGFYLLATDNSLWLQALSHAFGLVAIVIVDATLGLMNLASIRRGYLAGLAAAVLAIVLQLGDIVTAPQYGMTMSYFAGYLFSLPAFDLLLGLQACVLIFGVIGRTNARYLSRRRSRRGRELDYTRRGFLVNTGIIAGVVALAAALSSIKLPSSSVLQSTTTSTELGAPSGSIAKKSNLKVDTPVYFEYPAGSGYANVLMLLADGSVSAVSLYCTHVCCQLTWVSSSSVLYCQCHGSAFDPTGKVLQGPAAVALPKIELRIDPNGYIFPTGVSNPGPCQV